MSELDQTLTRGLVSLMGTGQPLLAAGYTGAPIDEDTVNTGPNDRIFIEMGAGGVDFPGIVSQLNSIGGKGWFTVELDRTATTAKDSAMTNRKYIQSVL